MTKVANITLQTVCKQGTPVIHYYHRDHLGNTCAVWNATADSVVQRTLYYAGGMPMAGSIGQPYQPYKYNGKEFVTAYGYDTYDYAFRNYYSAIGRFTSVDLLAEQYYSISPYAYCANNPVKYVDLDGREIEITGDETAKNKYLQMLHKSTGNIYQINKNNQLIYVGADANFTGNKSGTLTKIIQGGIDSKNTYSLGLVGTQHDDKSVFIDSYANKQIDISDLLTLGSASSALQGAVIGHFLNEVQLGGDFNAAHASSLLVEGVIYGELIGNTSISTRRDYVIDVPEGGFQDVIFEYDSSNRYLLKQGATSNSVRTGKFIGNVEITETIVVFTGRLKSARKLK